MTHGTTGEGRVPRRIAILGSCVTRDAFGFHRDVLPAPEPYFARSGLASAMSTTPFRGVDTSTIVSDFQRRVVTYDLEGTFATWLPEGEFDVLVLDAIDERFPLLVDADGAIATRSNEFLQATGDTSSCTVVSPDSEEHFARWEDAWGRFVAVAEGAGVLERVRVNQVRWASDFDGPGAEFAPMYSPAAITKANRILARRYARMSDELSRDQFFRYSDSELKAASVHQWGLAPFHYTPAFYRRFVQHLTGIVIPAPATEPSVEPAPSSRATGLWTRLRRRGVPPTR